MGILDMRCAACGKEIIDKLSDELEKKKIESIVGKSLGVLQEDGVYAFFLYLNSRKKDGGDIIDNCSFSFLKEDDILKAKIGDAPNSLQALRDKFKDSLDEFLFAKELLERTLTYARYHAKTLDNTSGTPEE